MTRICDKKSCIKAGEKNLGRPCSETCHFLDYLIAHIESVRQPWQTLEDVLDGMSPDYKEPWQ